MVTLDELLHVMPSLKKKVAKAQEWLPQLQAAMNEFDINTYLRECAFLAQIAHESGELRWFKEIWGPTTAQLRYEPVTTLSKQLGNTKAGDGKRYMGRGPIQITGRANYRKFGALLGIDLENNPVLAEKSDFGFRIAACFWHDRGLNALADNKEFVQITKKINGGTNGLADRQHYYQLALSSLSQNDRVGVQVELNGVNVSEKWAPLMKDDHILVGLRESTKSLGYGILSLAQNTAVLRKPNGDNLTVPFVNLNGTGYTPIASLGVNVEWDQATQTAKVTT